MTGPIRRRPATTPRSCAAFGRPIRTWCSLILPTEPRHRSGGGRDRPQGQAVRRRDGRVAVDRDQDPAWPVDERHRQFRLLATYRAYGHTRGDGLSKAVPGEIGGGRRRSLGYYLPPFAYADMQVLQQAVEGRAPSISRNSPPTCTPTRSRRSSATSPSTRKGSGLNRASWRCSSRT